MANILSRAFTAGFRLINGSHLNEWFDAINNAFNGTTAFPIQSSTAAGLTAAGTTQANALPITSSVNVITTAAASTGVVLPPVSTVGVGGYVVIFNRGANPIKVYGAGSDSIDGAASVTLTNALRCEYYAVAPGTWLSAQLGAVSA
ncbi:hypothetical protein ACTJJ7_16355 [Phyllobacterium sp. 22229]|uniref:hypothetical protein n=1 Tax=Phyllobacterium sp. 22229 TaxID=3453895 RepID=UPI003F84A91C